MQVREFGGVFAAMVTPFDGQGSINRDTLGNLARSLLDAGLSGLCPVGTTGEFLELNREEKKAAINLVCRAVAGRGAVIAGIWADNKAERLDLARAAAESGAQAVFLTTPVFYPATPASMLSWYRDLKRGTDLPVFAYNIPQFTTNEIPLEVLEALAKEGTIQGYKDSSPSAERIERVAARLRGKVPIFAGNEALYELALDLKFDGFISGIAGVFPGTVMGAWKRDRGAFSRLAAIKKVVSEHGGVAALKFLLGLKGLDAGEPRDLVAPLADGDRRILSDLFREFGPAEK